MRTKERLEVGISPERAVIGVCRSLGQGGFGITYLAEDELLGQKIVIKEYFPACFARRAGGWKYPDHRGDGPGLLLQRAGTASCGRRVFLLLFWMCRVS